jgi:hypothetical protein
MFGQIDLEITLAPSGVLGLGVALAAGQIDALAANAAANEIGISIPQAAAVAAAVAAEGISYFWVCQRHSEAAGPVTRPGLKISAMIAATAATATVARSGLF